MDIAERIAGMIEPALTGMGYGLVRVQLSGAARLTLQIMAERTDGENMTVDDCADISRAVSALLDVEDPIDAAYSLEVSSPGIDRPLVKAADYERWAGFEARIETAQPVDGRKRFRGRLIGLAGDQVKLRLDDGADAAVPLAVISRAKLMLTDDLIEAAQSGKRL
jgi:ribosome maturation factor RimP